MALESIKQEDEERVPERSSNEKGKTVRLRQPRWTRHEMFVLIEGKRVVENAAQKGRRYTSALGSDRFEPKWDLVSSFCRKHGVDRGPVQCRKRWSNMVVDFKKISNWEAQMKGKEGAESFWLMKNDAKRERRLPGFFDREVYNVLDGKDVTATDACPLALFIPALTDGKNGDGAGEEAAEDEEEPENMAEDGLSSDFDESGEGQDGVCPTETPTTMPTSGKDKRSLDSDTSGENTSEENRKKRRLSTDGCEESNYSEQLMRVLESNSNMLNAHLEAQNINIQLDRDQRKEQNNSLLAALSKIADALGRIADKI